MFYPARKEIWSVEHGTDRDDEVNRIFEGDNYGWAPTPGYNESRSMTDKRRFPNAHGPKWRSGSPTVATSGATFLTGSQWETWNGRLAVAMLKGEGVKLFTVGSDTRLSGEQDVLTDYGRIRTVQQGPDGLPCTSPPPTPRVPAPRSTRSTGSPRAEATNPETGG